METWVGRKGQAKMWAQWQLQVDHMGSSRVKVVHPSGPELSQDGQVYIPSMDVSCPVKGMTWVRQLSATRSILEGPDSWRLAIDSMSSIQGVRLSLDRGLECCSTVPHTRPRHSLQSGYLSSAFLSTSQAHCFFFQSLKFTFLPQDLCTCSHLCLDCVLCIPDLSSHPIFRHSSSFFRSLHQCCFSGEFSWPSIQVRMSGIYFQSLDTCQDSLLPLSLEFQVERDRPECQVSWLDGEVRCFICSVLTSLQIELRLLENFALFSYSRLGPEFKRGSSKGHKQNEEMESEI